jgi:hypothetical protein
MDCSSLAYIKLRQTKPSKPAAPSRGRSAISTGKSDSNIPLVVKAVIVMSPGLHRNLLGSPMFFTVSETAYLPAKAIRHSICKVLA